MFSTSLLPLPPPSTSLLPTFSQPATESNYHQNPHHPQPRRKAANRLNTPLTTLSHDERLITARKLAIAMYGYSWLKPAGCAKTMLGRREEELEREEVERQLREVELQERMAMEQEEQERREDLRRQAEGGETEGVEERDLDDEVPEAEEGSDGEEVTEDNEDEEEDVDDMDGDLDNDIPDADGNESSWVYDTRREPDTDSDEEVDDEPHSQIDTRRQRRRWQPSSYPAEEGEDNPAAAEAVVNAMLDEDELGEFEHQQDMDDDIPDADMDMDMDMDANLSDEVPEANDEPGWEHTDSELEESEMDISLLPPHPSSSSRNPGTTHEEMRRVSGNRMLHPMLPPSQSHSGLRQEHATSAQVRLPPQVQPRTAPRRNLRAMMQTPGTADDISALISTGGMSTAETNPATIAEEGSPEPRSPNRRSWLNPAGARRNLFSGFRTGVGSSNAAADARQPQSSQTAVIARTAAGGVSSGGLFTPSPRQAVDSDGEDGEESAEVPRSRTRSGRLLGGLGVVRRARRHREGET